MTDRHVDLLKEIRRLRKIEHLAWHVCESSEDRGQDNEIIVDRKDFEALSKALPMEHPPHGDAFSACLHLVRHRKPPLTPPSRKGSHD